MTLASSTDKTGSSWILWLVISRGEAVSFWVWLSAVWAAPFVVPALAGIFAPQSGSIPPKGGTTNLHVKKSQSRSDGL